MSNQKEEPKVILFIHPGSEHKITPVDEKLGFKAWNYKEHCRKFLKVKGNYISASDCQVREDKDIVFWGEWEPESYYEDISKQVKSTPNYDARLFPHYIHKPFYTGNSSGLYLQNTDPYVYGDNFNYCICNQDKKASLKDLPGNSLILFGSLINIGANKKRKSNPKFVLDTVFVINAKTDYDYSNIKNYGNNLGKSEYLDKAFNGMHISEAYFKCTLSKLKLRLNERQKKFKLYQGKCYSKYDSTFSFFPCTEPGNIKCYEKMQLDLFDKNIRDEILPHIHWDNEENTEITDKDLEQLVSRGIGCLLIKGKTADEVWFNIRDYVVKKGYNLGIRAEEPSIESGGYKDDYWNNFYRYM